MNSSIRKLFTLQEDNKRNFNSVHVWSLLWEMNSNTDRIIIVWMLAMLIKLEVYLKACWTTLKSPRNQIECFLLWCDLPGMQSFCKGIHFLESTCLKIYYGAIKFVNSCYNFILAILFFNFPLCSSRSLFGVLCLLGTSLFGTSEDKTESNL